MSLTAGPLGDQQASLQVARDASSKIDNVESAIAEEAITVGDVLSFTLAPDGFLHVAKVSNQMGPSTSFLFAGVALTNCIAGARCFFAVKGQCTMKAVASTFDKGSFIGVPGGLEINGFGANVASVIPDTIFALSLVDSLDSPLIRVFILPSTSGRPLWRME